MIKKTAVLCFVSAFLVMAPYSSLAESNLGLDECMNNDAETMRHVDVSDCIEVIGNRVLDMMRNVKPHIEKYSPSTSIRREYSKMYSSLYNRELILKSRERADANGEPFGIKYIEKHYPSLYSHIQAHENIQSYKTVD